MVDQLKGRTVFITGSGGVLGSTYVRRMLAEGARVIASDLKGHRADALVEEHGKNQNFRFYDLDVGVEEQCEEIFKRIIACASGEASKSEQHGYGQNEFVPWQLGAVM